MLIINEDNDHYFKYPSSEMTEEALRAYIDRYAASEVTHIFFCPSGQRTSYRSKVHDAIWDPLPDGSVPDNIWAVNCKLLFDRGIDPYSVWIDQCRKRNISPWLSPRMNDIHMTDYLRYFRHNNFWRKRQDLWQKPPAEYKELEDYPLDGSKYAAMTQTEIQNMFQERAFDYSKPDAFAFCFAVIKEQIERYDCDGYEIDWMRTPPYLTNGKEHEQSPILTEFMRRVRRLTDEWSIRRNHPIKVSARVPADPENALCGGWDVAAWVKEGLIDFLVISPRGNSPDPALSMSLWQEKLGDGAQKVDIIPCFDFLCLAGPELPVQYYTPSLLRAQLEMALAKGFRSFYLFNYPYLCDDGNRQFYQCQNRNPSDAETFRAMLKEKITLENLRQKRRRYSVTFRDYTAGGLSDLHQLPITWSGSHEFTLTLPQKPAASSVSIVIGLDGSCRMHDHAGIILFVNGKRFTNVIADDPSKVFNGSFGGSVWRFPIDPETLLSGENLIRVELPAESGTQRAMWLEIDVIPDEKGTISKVVDI